MRIWLLMMLLVVSPAQADWTPDKEDEDQVKAAATLEAFRNEKGDEAEKYLKESYGYAVFPSVRRIGLIMGWASGPGILIEDGEAVGRLKQRRFSLGAQVGIQRQGQIIFFKSESALTSFKHGHVEFAPQRSAAAGSSGGAVDGAFNPEVAVFSLTNSGFMAEASAGAVHYRYKPYP